MSIEIYVHIHTHKLYTHRYVHMRATDVWCLVSARCAYNIHYIFQERYVDMRAMDPWYLRIRIKTGRKSRHRHHRLISLCVIWLILLGEVMRLVCLCEVPFLRLCLAWPIPTMLYDMIHFSTCVRHDSIPMCDGTHLYTCSENLRTSTPDSFTYVWHDSFTDVCHDWFQHLCATWLIPTLMWDRTNSYVWHCSFKCVAGNLGAGTNDTRRKRRV